MALLVIEGSWGNSTYLGGDWTELSGLVRGVAHHILIQRFYFGMRVKKCEDLVHGEIHTRGKMLGHLPEKQVIRGVIECETVIGLTLFWIFIASERKNFRIGPKVKRYMLSVRRLLRLLP